MMTETIELKISLVLLPRIEIPGKSALYTFCSCRNVMVVISEPLTRRTFDARMSATSLLFLSMGELLLLSHGVERKQW